MKNKYAFPKKSHMVGNVRIDTTPPIQDWQVLWNHVIGVARAIVEHNYVPEAVRSLAFRIIADAEEKPAEEQPCDTAALKSMIDRAKKELYELCNHKKFTMSIPARIDYDSDLIIIAGLESGEKAVEEVERLRARNGELESLLRHAIGGAAFASCEFEDMDDLANPCWNCCDWSTWTRDVCGALKIELPKEEV